MIEYPRAHEREHSLEMRLPFLRRVLPDTPIVPLVMGVQSRTTSVGLVEILARVLAGTRVLLVASTDLSHYFDAKHAERLDSRVVDHVKGFWGASRRDGAISAARPWAMRCVGWGTAGRRDAGRPCARRHAGHGAQACPLGRCVGRQDSGRRLSGGGDVMSSLLAEYERQFLLRVARASATATVTGGDVDVPPILSTREGGAVRHPSYFRHAAGVCRTHRGPGVAGRDRPTSGGRRHRRSALSSGTGRGVAINRDRDFGARTARALRGTPGDRDRTARTGHRRWAPPWTPIATGSC